jgi:Flp pilus assembly protein protease CpaA
MQILFYIISIFFLFFNYKIIVSDLKHKKIPNKYLLFLICLVPFFYLYLFFELNNINYLMFFLSIFFATFISFILYYFWIWSAWDAKYLLVLSLFIPNIWIVPFIWNIALLTLIYLFIYFIYFYTYKLLFNKNYRKSFFENLMIDNKEKIKIFFANDIKWEFKKRNIIYKLLKSVIIFLTIFVIIRLSRVYIIDSLKVNFFWENQNIFNLKEFIWENITYLLWLWVIFTFLLYFIFRKIFGFLYKLFYKFIIKKIIKKDISKKDIWFSFLLVILVFLISFIIYEYKINWNEILHKLYLIFTIYLWLYLILKILFYSYKVTFHLAENDYINISDLKVWEIVDKNYLIKLFWTQYILWAITEKEAEVFKEWILYPNPAKYFENIDNPIDDETIKIIKNVYSEVNNYHKESKIQWFEEKSDIKILKTFAFWLYIFWWFIITFLLQNNIFKYISNICYDIIKNIYN